MKGLTKRQQQVLNFIQKTQQTEGITPSLRDIMRHFGFRSPRTVSDHVAALRKKGSLAPGPGLARGLKILSPLDPFRKRVADLPVYGSIPAAVAIEKKQEAIGCVTIDIGTLGIKPTPRTFALRARGDSMIGRHILDGDLVVVEHGQTPRNGDVVAALIDGESTLKTYVTAKGKPHLRAEHPQDPKLIPASGREIQGVMVALIRKRRE
jgi:repressor LexA